MTTRPPSHDDRGQPPSAEHSGLLDLEEEVHRVVLEEGESEEAFDSRGPATAVGWHRNLRAAHRLSYLAPSVATSLGIEGERNSRHYSLGVATKTTFPSGT